MKSITTKHPNTFGYTIKTAIIFLFFITSIKVSAQCTAFFTGGSNPQNNGTVYLYDSSTYTRQYMQCVVNWGDEMGQQKLQV